VAPSQPIEHDYPQVPVQEDPRVYQGNDDTRYSEVFQANFTRLCGSVMGSVNGDYAAAQDIAQVALFKFWQKTNSKHFEAAAQTAYDKTQVQRTAAYLWIAAHRLAIDLSQKPYQSNEVRPSEKTDLDIPSKATIQPSAEDMYMNSILDPRLSNALDSLDEENSAILIDAVIHGKSGEEIGTERGLPTGAVRARIHRTKAKLRDILGASYMNEVE
jgi:RNA polymerase sigma factor (sigma-70 family)